MASGKPQGAATASHTAAASTSPGTANPAADGPNRNAACATIPAGSQSSASSQNP